MKEILIFEIIAYSISNMIAFTDGPFDIFEKIRQQAMKIHEKLYYLLTCMICLPTYIGFILSFIIPNTPCDLIGIENIILKALLDGLFTSGCVWIIHTFVTFFEEK